MSEPKPPLEVFDELERGTRVRVSFEEPASDETFRPDDGFETAVEWVHSQRDETDETITYRAEFTPPEDEPDADVYYLEKEEPPEGEPALAALMAESNDDGDRTSRRIATVERIQLLD